MLNVEQIRQDFPILDQEVQGEPLIYFDNAATTQKPNQVVQQLVDYYQKDNANIHRGVHTLAQRATEQYEASRQILADFIGVQSNEIIFTSGTTAGINFLARSLVQPRLQPGDQIMVTRLEHHSNLVPWQELARRSQAELVFAPMTATYQVDLAALQVMDTNKLKVIAIQHVSNVLGIQQPLEAIVAWAHQHDILVLVDGAQAIAHQTLSVKELDVDAYCFSGHKMYGPTGIGVCYLAERWHEDAQPFNFGGEMIHQVFDTYSNYKEAPWKFEGGTPPIAQAIALAESVKYLQNHGLMVIRQHEEALTRVLIQGLQQVEGVTLMAEGPLDQMGHGIVSYNIDGVHPHDAATAYDLEGIAIRAGHHCAQPLMRLLQVPATLRASLAMYNTMAEVESFIETTRKVKEYFQYGA
ncbi:aminotransferase class V-fold PLP-dependent enzyme [Vaginisenegalia massiliensis]|uniref:aminotransferase class V-fold PLP-dependent enzyme n=1 Tax=Vaginisenegalia massiliensis TaxID=2058294 RepID=UPI0019D20C3E|nr:SufS family cysteine desulfurase [Vaginisenegalia massiliensis]